MQIFCGNAIELGSRKGLLAKGFKTRDKKKTSDRYIIERRKK
jgi:large subunit ribosomal protein L2